MRILLLGADGFIGSHLSASLLAAGHVVIAAVRRPARYERRFPEAEVVAIDLERMASAADWSDLVARSDAVVNAAGLLRDRPGRSTAAVHFGAPLALFEACLAAGGRKIVHISAVGTTADTDFAHSKREIDRCLRRLDLDWTILRPSLVYGPDSYGGTSLLRAIAATPLFLPLVGDGSQFFRPIHVADLARTVSACLEKPDLSRQVLYPCGPAAWTLKELLSRHRAWLGLAPAPFWRVPDVLAGTVAWLGDRFGYGAINSTTLIQLGHGDESDYERFQAASGLNCRRLDEALTAAPAAARDLWHARLYLSRPLIRVTLMALWLISGLLGLTRGDEQVAAVAAGLGLPAAPVAGLAIAASLWDIAIAGLLAWPRPFPRLAFWLQSATVVGYSLVLTLALPALWLDPLGPLLKNLPILLLILLYRVLEEER